MPNWKGVDENIIGFHRELQQKFPDLYVTSARRAPGQVGISAKGKQSRHDIGQALDLRVNPKIKQYLQDTKEGVGLLYKYNLGFLDESDPETMKKTNATGAHYHIGMDSTLVSKTKSLYSKFYGEQPTSDVQQDTMACQNGSYDTSGMTSLVTQQKQIAGQFSSLLENFKEMFAPQEVVQEDPEIKALEEKKAMYQNMAGMLDSIFKPFKMQY